MPSPQVQENIKNQPLDFHARQEFPIATSGRCSDSKFKMVKMYYSGWTIAETGSLYTKSSKKWMCIHNGIYPELTLRSDPQSTTIDRCLKLDGQTEFQYENGLSISIKGAIGKRLKLRFPSATSAQNWFDLIYQAISHGKWLQHIRVQSQLGKGAFSKVMLCKHQITKENFALKVVDGTIKSNPEIEILHKIASSCPHPNLVETFRVFENTKRTCILMPVYRGNTLFELLRSSRRVSEDGTADIISSIASALNAIHAVGIIHCDLKLENVMLTKECDIKIIDFGGAIDLATVKYVNRAGSVGTPGYISPERLQNKAAGPPADVFSLGIICYQLLVGTHPFSTHDAKLTVESTQKYDTKLDSKRWNTISSEAKEVVKGMMERDPTKRMTLDQVLAHTWLTPTLLPLATLKTIELDTKSSKTIDFNNNSTCVALMPSGKYDDIRMATPECA